MRANMARLASGLCAGSLMMVVAATQSSAQSYKAPKTPWGDPDIQGNYTNLTEAGTPLERPKEFEDKQLNEISAEELRTIHDTRIIPLTSAAHLGKSIRSDFGDSRGHWEGD